MNWFIQGILFILANCNVLAQNYRFQERYSWTIPDFQFPDKESRQAAIDCKEYIPINNVIHGIEIWRDRFFVSIPRWKAGVASTLNYFKIENDCNKSPEFIPYPDYKTNQIRNNEKNFKNKIVSVVRMQADVCDRLWFVDMGVIDITGSNRQVITPRLFVYDLNKDKPIHIYTLTKESSRDSMFGGSIVIDVSPDDCSNAFAYIPDFQTNHLVVYSYRNRTAWRIRHSYFFPDPFASPFHIDGEFFLWVDGILGATLSDVQKDGYKTLYFAPLASNNQFSVSTKYLRDPAFAKDQIIHQTAYHFLGNRGSDMQSTAHMMNPETGIDFYPLPNKYGIGCWNSKRYPNQHFENTTAILATDHETMIFPIDVILDNSDNVWLLTDRLAVSLSRGLNPKDVNMRLFSANIRDVVKGTVCEPINKSHHRIPIGKKNTIKMKHNRKYRRSRTVLCNAKMGKILA